jgi:S-adenosylmethionine:tRNA ribosyltransferase-isomerase
MSTETTYNYNLPKDLIAQKPAHPRDHARLLVYRVSDGTITDDIFYNLPKYLPTNTTLVLNDSKVDNCRWLFDDGKTELFLLEKNDPLTIRAMVRPGRKFKKGATVALTDWLMVTVTSVDHEGIRTLRMNVPHNDPRLKQYEHIPLPPYIHQDDRLAPEYQTVYAKPLGSLAAPTAGLHFTQEMLENIKDRWPIAKLTLHVGLGTFAKLTKENLKSNKLHEEWYEINKDTAAILNASHHRTAVGTTSIRTLESAIGGQKNFMPKTATTDIFIRPGYHFKATNGLITNFHLPSTSLLMLVAAFIADKKGMTEIQSINELKRIYDHAVNQNYKFYSFGDAMYIV